MATFVTPSAISLFWILVLVLLNTEGSHGQYFQQLMPPQSEMSMAPYLPQPAMGVGVVDGSVDAIARELYLMQEQFFPPEIIRSKNRLLGYLAHSNLNLIQVAERIPELEGLDPLDRMIGVLLALQQTIPFRCQPRRDLNRIVMYALMKSYFNHVPLLDDSPDVQYNNHNGQPHRPVCKSSAELVKALFYKLVCCERKLEQKCPPPQVVYMERPVAPRSLDLGEEIQYVDNPCPTPGKPEVATAPTARFGVDPVITTTEVPNITTETPTTTTVPPSTTTEMTTTEVMLTTTDLPLVGPYASFVSYLPKPKNSWEKVKYNMMKLFLERRDLGLLLGTIDFPESATDDKKLNILLIQAHTLHLEQPLLDCIMFYINYTKSLQALSLIRQKEIRKQFELTEILVDTLPFDSLDEEGKHSFDKFYTFVASVNKDQLKDFDSWSEVKTKGEFMHVLFDYFIGKDFVPEDVTKAILYLKPLILMDGPGAMPP